jgi:putative DNA-invertase from lambdoid prophage Rac
MKAALYARISTDDQHLDGQSVELVNWASKNNIEYELFLETASGKDVKGRVIFTEMIARANNKEFTHVVVYKLDRFGRSMSDIVLTMNGLNKNGVKFVSINEGIDLSSPSGELMANLLSAFAQYELSIIRERTKMGLRAAKARGKILGHKPREFDMDKFSRLRSNNVSIEAIAQSMGFSRSQVYRRLRAG